MPIAKMGDLHNKVLFSIIKLYFLRLFPMTVQIRQSGGSKIVSLPANLLKRLGWDAGQELEISLMDNRLVINAVEDNGDLESLLQGCSPKVLEPTAEEKEWLDTPSMGKEV